MKYGLGYLNILSFVLIILYVSIHIPTFSMATYERHYAEHGTAQKIGVSDEDLMRVTRHLIRYMGSQYDDLIVYATVNGEYRQFFNEREIYHMWDVRVLFTVGRVIVGIAIAVFLLTSFYAYKNLEILTFVKCAFYGTLGLIVSLLALIGIIFIDFNRAFIIFHEIFFFNDLWLLNPATDLLINLVPEIFFVNIFVRVMIIFVTSLVTIIVASFLLKNRVKG